jgi:tight adherence protein B
MKAALISLSGFTSVFLAIYGLYLALTQQKRSIEKRMQKVTEASKKSEGTDTPEKARGISIKSLLGSIGGVFLRRGMTKELEAALTKADIPLRGEEFLTLWILLATLPGTLIYLWTFKISLAVVIFILGIGAPPLMLNLSRHKRLKKFDRQLGESLSIISNALRAGFSFIQAMEMISREMPNPLAKEFARSYREMNLGTPLEESLKNMVKRIDSNDLDLLITAVLIQRQVGGNLAEILDNISNTIRERIRIQGEIHTLTAQGRITGIIIGLIPPVLVLLLLVINPSYMRPLFNSPIGWTMIAAGLISEAIGIMVIKKIITIDL